MSIPLLELAASKLGVLADGLVFVGGATIAYGLARSVPYSTARRETLRLSKAAGLELPERCFRSQTLNDTKNPRFTSHNLYR